MNLNHSQIPLNTHKKFHQNRSSRLEGVQLQTHSQKNYIYKDISCVRVYVTELLLNDWADFDEMFCVCLWRPENGLEDSQLSPLENVFLIYLKKINEKS